MPKVKVRFISLTHLTDGEKETFFDTIDMSDLFEKIKGKYEKMREKAFNPKTGNLYPEFIITVNDKQVHDYSTRLREEDVVSIIPVFSGG